MKARFAVAGLGLLLIDLLVCGASQAQTTQPAARNKITGENRLFMRFIEDAAIVPSYWLEGQGIYLGNQPAFLENDGSGSESGTLRVGPVFALNVAEDFEFGARIGLVRRDPEGGGSDTGLTDLDLWGKFSVVSDPVKVSLGLLLSAPTGDEDKFLGTGETDVEFFAGIRKDFRHLSLAGNAGLRINQDPGFGDLDLEGKNSILIGGAALFPATEKLTLTAEWALETERYEGLDNDSRLLGGFEFKPGEGMMIRGALGGGLSNGSPDIHLQGSVVWLF